MNPDDVGEPQRKGTCYSMLVVLIALTVGGVGGLIYRGGWERR
jgi:hypothetical protein